MRKRLVSFDDDLDTELDIADIEGADVELEDLVTLAEEEDDEPDGDVDEDRWIPKWKRSNCPKSDTGHSAIKDPIALKFGRTEYVCQHCHKRNWTPSELEFIADQILKEDSNAELCRECAQKNKDSDILPYGRETGHVEWQLQIDENGDALLDDNGDAVYIGFPELICDKGHRWFKGEGPRRNINGKNPILFESHIYNRKRREIYPVDGVPDPAFTMDRWGKRPTVGMYNRCVDDKTQALTPEGWKGYNQLAQNDLIWTYDIKTDSCEWQPLLEDPFVNESFNGMVQVLESENISARVTEGHRWAVAHESNKQYRYEVVTALSEYIPVHKRHPNGTFAKNDLPSQLVSRHYIPLARPEKHLITEGRLDLFELLGWVLSDGTYRQDHDDCVVYQAMHNRKLPELIGCLERNGINTQPNFVDENNVGRWRIPVPKARPMREITGGIKSMKALPLDQFSHGEYQAILKGYMLGDGYVRKNKNILGEIASTKVAESEAIQGLLARLGITSYSYHNHQPTAFCVDMYPVNLKKVQWAYVRPALQPDEYYEGTVWCPTVDNGFWVAKRNNKVYVTGNTHPEGRKTNSETQRARGSGYYR